MPFKTIQSEFLGLIDLTLLSTLGITTYYYYVPYFYRCSYYTNFFFKASHFIIGSHIVFSSILGRLSRSLKPYICAIFLRRPKRCEHNNKDEDNSPNILKDRNVHAS